MTAKVLPFNPRRDDPYVHWRIVVAGPGGGYATVPGCLPNMRIGKTTQLAGEHTTDPDKVTCKVCRALPSYRRAARTP